MGYGRFLVFFILFTAPLYANETTVFRSADQAIAHSLKTNLHIQQQHMRGQADALALRSKRTIENPEIRGRYEADSSWRQLSVGTRLRLPNPLVRSPLLSAADSSQEKSAAMIEGMRWQLRCDVKEMFYRIAILDLEYGLLTKQHQLWQKAKSRKLSRARRQLVLLEIDDERRRIKNERSRAKFKIANMLSLPASSFAFAYKHKFKKPVSISSEKLTTISPAASNQRVLSMEKEERQFRLKSIKRERIPWFKFVDLNYERQPTENFIWNVQLGIEVPIFDNTSSRIKRQQTLLEEIALVEKIGTIEGENQLRSAASDYAAARQMYLDEYDIIGSAANRIGKISAKGTTSLKKLERITSDVAARRIYLQKFLALKTAEVSLERIAEKPLNDFH